VQQENDKAIIEKYNGINFNIKMIHESTSFPITERAAKGMLARKSSRRSVSFQGGEPQEEQVQTKGITHQQIAAVLQSMEYTKNTLQSRRAMKELSVEARRIEYAAFEV
jgi:hypothetical protein